MLGPLMLTQETRAPFDEIVKKPMIVAARFAI
jgi:hypothetical protein